MHGRLLRKFLASALGRRRRALPKPGVESVALCAAQWASIVEEHAFVNEAGASPNSITEDTAHARLGFCPVPLKAQLTLDQHTLEQLTSGYLTLE